jgi:endonuclease YncB( thermonuclease family)
MRKIGLLGLAVLAAIAAALIWHIPDRLERLTEPVVSQLSPAAIAPPPPPPVAEPAPAAPATPELAPLPSREVAQIPFHAVPENEEPPKPQPFQMHDSPGLAPSRQASRGGGQAASPPPRQLAGRAEAIGADAIRVDGRELRLFGVQPPAGNDRCDGTLCTERARAVLAGRLSRTASCRFPTPGSSSAICLDGNGVDLGGLLVGEGLALADRSQSFDYVGAESIAKSQKRGLWQLR